MSEDSEVGHIHDFENSPIETFEYVWFFGKERGTHFGQGRRCTGCPVIKRVYSRDWSGVSKKRCFIIPGVHEPGCHLYKERNGANTEAATQD